MNVQNLILIFLIIILIIILLIIINIKNLFENVSDSTRKTWVFVFSILGGLFVLVSLFIPYCFTNILSKTDMDPNAVGDTIGGTMGPFVAIAGVIFTFLAFYMQKLANDEIKNQFKIQQFENQFYEMLKLHKDNVNELEIEAKKKKRIEGPKNPYFEFSDYLITKRNVFDEFKNELEFMIEKLKESDTNELNSSTFQEVYDIYFLGLSFDPLLHVLLDASPKTYKNILYELQDSQYSKNIYINMRNNIKFNIPAFKGHSNLLGHYYRHLYHIVKFVTYYDDKILNKKEKTRYLRLLRAQLSNNEQAMLFYNWLSTYGESWDNESNNFFTEFKMIHNLRHDELLKNSFIKKRLRDLLEKNKRLGFTDNLFEIGDRI